MRRLELPPQHPFTGIAAKLNRSNENIKNLEAEIASFFEKSEYPVLSNEKGEIVPEAVKYHSELPVPPRFKVLSGEVIHHLRSCLDHIVWHFSDTEYRRTNISWVGFPILKDEPAPADVFVKYERKIKGITDTRVRDLVESLQPYRGSDPRSAILLAINRLDIVDKHRTLVIVSTTGAMQFPLEMMRECWANMSNSPLGHPSDFIAQLNFQGKLVPQVAFSDFVGQESEPVIQALGRMHNAVLGIVSEFDNFLKSH